MTKFKVSKPSATVAEKDNTQVARTRVNELVGDKPRYMFMSSRHATKSDTLKYKAGFSEQILKDKIAGKATYKETLRYGPKDDGRAEASVRRGYDKNHPYYNEYHQQSELKPAAMVRDSSLPLAPTQFPD